MSEKVLSAQHGPQPKLVEIGCELCPHARRLLRTGSRRAWTKKLRLNGRLVAWRSVVTCSRTIAGGSPAQPIEPNAPALHTAAASVGV